MIHSTCEVNTELVKCNLRKLIRIKCAGHVARMGEKR
jgi:hypothetical protein